MPLALPAAAAPEAVDQSKSAGSNSTLLAVTGLTHRQSYGDIFVITCLKTMAVFLIIGIYYATGLT